MDEKKFEKRLYTLSELEDFQVASGDPDVRGWKVFSADGKEFGRVHELLVDPERLKVRYLDVDVNEELQGVSEDHHLLVPIGTARIDEKDDHVHISTVETVTMLKTPSYKGAVTREYEDTVRKSYWPDKADFPVDDDEYYDDDNYKDDNFYDPRRRGK